MVRVFRYSSVFDIFFPSRTWRMKEEKAVYLTFDDGPTETTDWILDFLKEKDIKATFFCVGANVERYPERYERLLREGHSVGNHTMNHDKATDVSPGKYLDSIHEASKWIDSKLFRPPYGRLPKQHRSIIPKDMGVVMWSWLSYDFDPEVPTAKIIDRAKRITSGDVLVFHDNEKVKERVREILPSVIDLLQRKGFDFKTFSA